MDPELAKARRERLRARMGLAPSPPSTPSSSQPQATPSLRPAAPVTPSHDPIPSFSLPRPEPVVAAPRTEKKPRRVAAPAKPNPEGPNRLERIETALILVCAVVMGVLTPKYGFATLLILDFVVFGGPTLVRSISSGSAVEVLFQLFFAVRRLWTRFHVIAVAAIVAHIVAVSVSEAMPAEWHDLLRFN